MATKVRARFSAERRFYAFMAFAMIAFMLIGFAPTFYLKGVVPPYPRPGPALTPFFIAHGALFTLWMLVFAAQTMLVAAGRRDVHMRLGQLGLGLAVLIVPVMYLAAITQVPLRDQPPFTTPLGWTSVPLAGIPPFVILVWLGWKHRRDAQAHKRLMLSAALLFMAPAVGRWPIAPPTLLGHTITQGLSWLCFAPLFWWDLRTLGRLHWATRAGASLALAAVVIPILLMATGGWDTVAAHLPGL